MPSASTPDRRVHRPRIPRTAWLCPAVLHNLGSEGGAPGAHPWPHRRVPPHAAACLRPRGGSQPSPHPTPHPRCRPHIVDDHGLVSDDVVGLHGPAEPALPSRLAAGGPAGYKARGETWTDRTPDTAPLPSPSALPTRTLPHGQSQVPADLIDGRRPGGVAGGSGRSLLEPANQLKLPGRTAGRCQGRLRSVRKMMSWVGS